MKNHTHTIKNMLILRFFFFVHFKHSFIFQKKHLWILFFMHLLTTQRLWAIRIAHFIVTIPIISGFFQIFFLWCCTIIGYIYAIYFPITHYDPDSFSIFWCLKAKKKFNKYNVLVTNTSFCSKKEKKRIMYRQKSEKKGNCWNEK